MQQGILKAAAATPVIRVADCQYNKDAIICRIRQAREDGAMLVVLSELCLSGYTCQDLLLQDALQNGVLKALASIVEETAGHPEIVVVGAPLVKNHLLYNCAAVLQNGRILGVVPKTFLPNYGEFYEKRFFSPAPEENGVIRLLDQDAPFGNKLIFVCDTMPAFAIGVEICEDLWVPLPPSTKLAENGASVLVNLSASDEAVTKSDYRRMIVTSQSARTTSAYVFCSAGEGESTTDLVFSGHCIVAEDGDLVDEAPPFGKGYVATDLDLSFLSRERRRLNKCGKNDADIQRVHFSLPLSETRLTRIVPAYPFVAPFKTAQDHRTDETLAIQAHGLKKRIQHTNAKKLVVGVSGGVDSTLALLVAKEALRLLERPAADIVAITMPCFGTSRRTHGNAEILCDALQIPLREIDITPSVTQHLKDLGHDLTTPDVVFENAQARERTQVLMDMANMVSGMVIGTGDLSELALGFATYNGDHMSMYGVNAGVPKTMIRCMLLSLARRSDDKMLADVLNDIVDTPVSPELLPPKNGEISQITEDVVGSYALNDFYLYHVIRRGEAPEKIIRLAIHAFAGVYDAETIRRWYRVFVHRFFSQQFKRSCLPDGPRIGSVALSPRGDWRMPSDAIGADWQET